MDTLDPATLGKLKEMVEQNGGQPPSRKAMLDMVEALDLSEDVKENLRVVLTGDVPKVFGGYFGGSLLAVVFILIVFMLLLFFGYKLFKSIKEKEKKREEKKKAKQMKKKK